MRKPRMQGLARALKGLARDSLAFIGYSQPVSPEQSFRFLARRLNYNYRTKGTAPLFVISPAEPHGAAPLDALMLASSLADEISARVLLIDSWFGPTDSISHALGLEGEPGFAQLLARDGSQAGFLIQETARPGVSFLPRGPDLAEVDRLRIREHVAEVIRSVSGEFDFVLVVQNAVTGDTRGFELIAHSSCVIILARDGVTRIADIDDQEAALTQNAQIDVRVVLAIPAFFESDEAA